MGRDGATGLGPGGRVYIGASGFSLRSARPHAVIRFLVPLSSDESEPAAKSLVMKLGRLSRFLWDRGRTVLTTHLALLEPPPGSDPKAQREGERRPLRATLLSSGPWAAAPHLAGSLLARAEPVLLSLSRMRGGEWP